jgi:hypothetical protein
MTKVRTAALALAGILAITAASATSASAQWRGHRGGWGPGIGLGIGAGIAAGALIGSAVAAQGYGPGYYYDEPVYGPGYGAPVYYAQPYGYAVAPAYYGYYGYRYGRCYTDEGYGRRASCGSGGGGK